MTIAVYKFNRAKEFILGGSISLLNDTLKIALLAPGFKYSDTMETFSNIRALEIPSTAQYIGGGEVLTGKAVYTSGGKAHLTVGPVEYPQVDATIANFIVYADTAAGTVYQPLICYGVLPTQLNFKLSTFRLNWPNPLISW